MVHPKRQMDISSESSILFIHARDVRDSALGSVRNFNRLAEETSLNS